MAPTPAEGKDTAPAFRLIRTIGTYVERVAVQGVAPLRCDGGQREFQPDEASLFYDVDEDEQSWMCVAVHVRGPRLRQDGTPGSRRDTNVYPHPLMEDEGAPERPQWLPPLARDRMPAPPHPMEKP